MQQPCQKIVCRSHAFWYFCWLHAAQQVSNKEAVSLHLTQPAVASKVEPEVGPDHIRHRHPVQEPAGIQTRVVVLDPEAKEEHDAGGDVVQLSQGDTEDPGGNVCERTLPYLFQRSNIVGSNPEHVCLGSFERCATSEITNVSSI